MQIVTVLRSGGEYKSAHAQALAKQIEEHAFPYTLLALSDLPIDGVDTLDLRRGWPGWWSKMELFELDEDFLYFDLDTVITAGLEAIVGAKRLTVLRDPYWRRRDDPTRIGSGVMFVPRDAQQVIRREWLRVPDQHMRMRGGDQAFLQTFWKDSAARWQDLLPGQLTSYKVEKRGPDTRVLYFHGKPRPWAVPEFRHLYEEAA